MEMLDNLDKNPATGMGKKVSTVHTLCILVLSLCRGLGNGYRLRARHSPNPLFLKRFQCPNVSFDCLCWGVGNGYRVRGRHSLSPLLLS